METREKKPETVLGRLWYFIWKDNSLASWIVSLILAFLIVKFIFFPGLSLILGSSMPLVVVESSSMHHPGGFVGNVIGSEDSFEVWWGQKSSWYLGEGITKQEAIIWPLKTGLEIGDIVAVSEPKNLKTGDIIIFEAGEKHPLIHRIVEIKNIDGKIIYETKGDNNSGQLSSEKDISEDKIIGKALFRIPQLGWIKLVFVKIFQVF